MASHKTYNTYRQFFSWNLQTYMLHRQWGEKCKPKGPTVINELDQNMTSAIGVKSAATLTRPLCFVRISLINPTVLECPVLL